MAAIDALLKTFGFGLALSCPWLAGCSPSSPDAAARGVAESAATASQSRPIAGAQLSIAGGKATLTDGVVGRFAGPTLASGSQLTIIFNHYASQAADGTVTLESEFPATCRGTTPDGRPAFQIEAHVRANGNTTTYDLLDPASVGTRWETTGWKTIDVPATTDGKGLELWFTGGPDGASSDPSCTTKTYSFAVVDSTRVPELSFSAGGAAVASMPVTAGGFLRIHWDEGRLAALSPRCDGITGYAGGAAWDVYAHVQVDGKDVASPTVTYAKDWGTRAVQDVLVGLPDSGKELTVWFVVSGRDYYENGPQCTAYDSNYGRNFNFPIQSR